MRRRRFLTGLAGVLILPGVAAAQPTDRTYRLGWLSSGAARTEAYSVAFTERLRELGFVEGRNLIVEFRSAATRNERLPELAADLVRLNCDVLLAPGSRFVLAAAKQASRDTPIVMVAIDYDPLATGDVASLARPGGRVTGVSQHQLEAPGKRLELLRELIPKVRRVAVLADAATTGQLPVVQAAAKRLGIVLQTLELKTAPYDYDGAFADAARGKAEALLALTSGNFVPARRRIPELALKHRLPSMFGNYLWAEAGGLVSYGPDFLAIFRRAAEQVALVLRGTKPADLPIEQASEFEMVINLKTARALGITIPPSLQARIHR
ncbi:MAG TPA: ABC transporter substrate-binding protein, partial [Terriglobales bacterium]|nr:ABC transporter substrate-binding protein [Terriglobales bacterium]